MKVIFLDIDGVLVTNRNFRDLFAAGSRPADMQGRHLFDPRCTANLNRVIEATGAKIVLSSTWKMFGKQIFTSMWHERGMPGEIIDLTPNFSSRGVEIDTWLSKHDGIESFVIIDDDIHDLLPRQLHHIVHTTWECGFVDTDAEKAITILEVVK